MLGGSGICLLDGAAFEVGRATASSTACGGAHAARRRRRARRARVRDARCRPRPRTFRARASSWIGGTWVEAGVGDHPWEREAAAGEPEVPEVGARPASVVNVDDVEGDHDGGSWRLLARHGRRGAERAQLGQAARRRGERAAAPPLGRRGDLRRARGRRNARALAVAAARSRAVVEYEEQPVRAGHVISRPASSGIAHGLRAGEGGHVPSSRTARATRTTSATTRARTRSTSAASA